MQPSILGEDEKERRRRERERLCRFASNLECVHPPSSSAPFLLGRISCPAAAKGKKEPGRRKTSAFSSSSLPSPSLNRIRDAANGKIAVALILTGRGNLSRLNRARDSVVARRRSWFYVCGPEDDAPGPCRCTRRVRTASQPGSSSGRKS